MTTPVTFADDPWDHGMMDGGGWWAGLGWLLGLLVVRE